MKIKKLLNLSAQCLVIAGAAASMASCGGGSSSTASTTTTTTTPITVTPALGGFSSGAGVKAVKPDGTTIASSTTDSTGSATLDLGSYSGPMTLVVTGATGVTYYDEKSGTNLTFGATDTLLSVVPGSAVTSGSSYGVTSITNMAAAFAGVTSTGVITGASTDAINTTITNAVAQTQLTLGIPTDQLNILAAPKAVTSTTSKLSGTGTDVKYGLILAEFAKSSTTTALAQSTALAVSASSSKTTGAAVSGTDYTNVVNKVNTRFRSF
jgi:hypothetical protein